MLFTPGLWSYIGNERNPLGTDTHHPGADVLYINEGLV